MDTFQFQATTKILFGVDEVRKVVDEAHILQAKKLFIVTDKGIVRAGLLDRVTKPLDDAGIDYVAFDDIEPNPKTSTILEGAAVMREAQANVVVGLGGGSPMDAAKAIAVMAINEGLIEQYCGVGSDPWPEPPAPIIAIPTTAGTGAEVSGAAMLNLVSESRKVDMFGKTILPVTAILDPKLTEGLPPNLTACTGIDALNHAFEAYIASYSNTFTDTYAEKAIELAINNIRRVYKHPDDLEARGHMLISSTMAVLAANAGLGVVHSLAQTIGGYYDAPHGLSIAICFVPGIEYNLTVEQKKLARISQIMGTDTSGLSLEEAAKSVIPALQNLLRDLDIPTGFDTLGVKEKDIPRLAEIAMLDGCTPTNPRPLDVDAFTTLFERGLTN